MFESFAAVLMLIVFSVPGFVWRTVEGQFAYLDKRLEWEKYALGLLCRSTFVYLPLAPCLYQAWQGKLHDAHPFAAGAVALVLILLLPALLGFLCGVARQNNWRGRPIRRLRFGTFEQSHIPTAWDSVFSEITPKWAIATQKSGGLVYGYFGAKSHASSTPDERDLFISHVVQQGFEFAKDTRGLYLRDGDVTSSEFTEPDPTARGKTP